MAIIVDLQNDAGFADAPALPDFERWVTAALRESYVQLEQTICIVDEALSRDLNHRFRGKDSATNVLAFPGIFRGALDANATDITEGMKLAAAIAIAESVTDAQLSPDFVVPSVFDRTIVERVAPAVAAAAIKDGVIRKS